ncbi:MAG: protein jag [Spirochaetes bacterium]|nr:protein jag [Spirochaetota bacterium]
MILREFSGGSENEALEIALDTLKLKQDQLEIEYESKFGIFPFGKKQVVAKVSFEDELAFGNRSLMLVKDLLEKMNIEAKIYLIEENDEKIVIEIESPDSALIIGKKGKNLEALQVIVNVIMNKDSKKWTKVMIDIGDYRKRRESTLKKLALQTANQVRKSQQSILLEPMNPFERRIIHMELKNETRIETVSEGDGTIKRIKVLYKEN